MPPFVPRKRVSSEDPPSTKRHHAIPAVKAPVVEDSEDDSPLSDVPNSDNEETPGKNDATEKGKGKSQGSEDEDEESDDDDDDATDWEDAIDTTNQPAHTTALLPSAIESQDLELTLDKNEVHVADLLDGKKGPSKIERQIRIRTHCLHVQLLLAHNAVRNAWVNNSKVHETLRRRLPQGIYKEIKKWRVASALDPPEQEITEKSTKKRKGKEKQTRNPERDWGEGSSRLEPGKPDMSLGDPIISLLKVLAAYWRKQFKITAPGLRKHGYQHMAQVDAEIRSFNDDGHDPERHGERFASVDEFRSAADCMEGSRDTGAQLFTALLRALDIEARLVVSLQPLGFGWTKAETHTPKSKMESEPGTAEATETGAELDDDEESDSDSPDKNASSRRAYDRDLPFPIYWTEVASPITHQVIPVDPLVLKNPVATTPELQATFEPRGAKAEKAKQVICYVIAYSPDKSAKDVTTRYLRRRTWPGKTKCYRMPIEKIPVPGKKGKFFEYDWFRVIFRIYQRPQNQRTPVDDVEDTQDLTPKQPEKKLVKEGDTLQSLRASTEFVLERFLRREEALRPDSKPVRTFTTGKGVKAKTEDVYRRSDVVKCLSAESWHKEGRQTKIGEAPLKRVPIRAVTLLRKREVDELQRQTGEKPKQGLYAKYQTEYIIPPPIENGIIPKNDYGNIDCFVPSMVPRGAVHIPWSGTVRICKKLGVDYAEAVTGFEFGSKMAVPVIEGVVVAEENEGLVTDAWMAEEAEKRKREQLKAEKRILQTWRKFLFGLRIAERVREEYGGAMDYEEDEANPFAKQIRPGDRERQEETAREDEVEGEDEEDSGDRGGGFLLPGEDDGDDGGLVVERQEQETRPRSESHAVEISDSEGERKADGGDDDGFESAKVNDENSSSVDELPDSEEEYQPRTRRQTRSRKG
ncbi:Rad4 family protein [Aspergillus ruber CBS 135680]|uniref:Rad4 family protein n=1 Tax=Aspergillus ruber (strain CBS 135680) TaxID=1388766 RepID=A0A017SL46_ASPRC|nr:Rad4 family protein [Aspergillus ruber CBS 135680]EYE97652.1 Rad4 family protein [Aspergillus ruber CBS 135680]